MNLDINNIIETCNENQKKFVLDELKDGTLMGIPGGGKTTTIIKKILYLLNNKKLQNKKEFMMITFSKKAKDDFIKRGSSFISECFTKNNVKTLHSLAGTIIKKIEKTESQSTTSTTSSIEIAISKALKYINETQESDLKKIKCLSELKLIIIDEAQDISEIQYNLSKIICEKLNLTLILAGDPDQNIYQFQNGSDKYLFNHSKNIYYLTDNYRSSPEIISILNAIKPWKHLIPAMNPIKKNTGIKPIIYLNSLENIFEHFKIKLNSLKEKYNLKEIAIIGPVKKSNLNKYNTYTNIGLQHFVNYLEKNNIKYIKHYNESSSNTSNQDDNTISKEYKDDHINLLTIHGSKGLEFKAVFILNFHTNTYGRMPSELEYNNFKYLWYVGLSRAENDLIMYSDSDKNIWYEIYKCDKSTYNFYGKEMKLIPPLFNTKEVRPSSITELLRSKKYFDENILLELSDYIKFNIKEIIDLYPINNNNNNIESEYPDLYGIYYEQIFEYYYCKKYNRNFKLSEDMIKYIEKRILIDKKYKYILSTFLRKINMTMFDLLDVNYLNEKKILLNQKEIEFFNYLMNIIILKKLDNFYIYIENDLVYDNSNEILEICNNINTNVNIPENIFKLVLYKYQYNNEAKYLWSTNIYSDNKEQIEKIKNYITSINNNNYEFQIDVSSKYIDDLNGIIDIYNKQDKEIIEIKYTKSTSLLHYLQIFLYNILKNNNKENLEQMSIINLYEGKKYILYYNSEIKIIDILLKLSNILQTKIKNICILYDLETTGLIKNNYNSNTNSIESEKLEYPDIIDRNLYEINLKEELDNGLINPGYKISREIELLTNITNTMLENTKETIIDLKSKLDKLNNNFINPTYIAHNGNSFDHKIMINKNILDANKIKFKDSRQIIINLTKNNEIPLTGSLSNMYKQLFNKESENAHRAKADVKMTYEIIEKLNLKSIINN